MDIKLQNENIYINVWEPRGEPVGIIQIIHGMSEHSGRYEKFARFLNKEGYLVVATDHRGHGKSIKNIKGLGILKEDFMVLVEDEIELTNILAKRHPKLPLYILGHSMGSFIAQGHLKAFTGFKGGYILSGSNLNGCLKTFLGSIIAVVIKIITKDKKSKLLDRLLFAGYNKKIKESRTKFDWLTRDRRVVEEYISDPKCGYIYNARFYASFLRYLSRLPFKDDFKNLNKNLNILIFSGDRDPVGEYGVGVKRLYNFYKKLGYKNVDFKLYEKGRHEMLNETNKLEVFEDILNYIKLTLEKNNFF